jgi:hypothetical protein
MKRHFFAHTGTGWFAPGDALPWLKGGARDREGEWLKGGLEIGRDKRLRAPRAARPHTVGYVGERDQSPGVIEWTIRVKRCKNGTVRAKPCLFWAVCVNLCFDRGTSLIKNIPLLGPP